MADLGLLVERFPRDELSIHRLYARSDDFREVCDDLLETLIALSHWESARGSSDARVAEYRQLVEELEAEMARLVASERDRTG